MAVGFSGGTALNEEESGCRKIFKESPVAVRATGDR